MMASNLTGACSAVTVFITSCISYTKYGSQKQINANSTATNEKRCLGDLSCRTLWYREREGITVWWGTLPQSGVALLHPLVGMFVFWKRRKWPICVQVTPHSSMESASWERRSIIASTQLIYLFTRHLTSGMLVLLMFGTLLNEMSARQSKYNTQIKFVSHQACRNVARPSQGGLFEIAVFTCYPLTKNFPNYYAL